MERIREHLDNSLMLVTALNLHIGSEKAAQISLKAYRENLTLRDAALRLGSNHRTVIVLHDVEGLSMAEVADALGISVTTAKVRAHRARLRLRKRLGTFLSHTTVDVPS